MEIPDIIDLIANILAISVLAVKATRAAARWLTPRAQSVWRHTQREFVAEVAAMQTARLRRKTALIAVPAWAVGGFSSYLLMGGVADAAPLWATCWGGSVSLAFWCIAGWQGWLAVRCIGRRAWLLVR